MLGKSSISMVHHFPWRSVSHNQRVSPPCHLASTNVAIWHPSGILSSRDSVVSISSLSNLAPSPFCWLKLGQSWKQPEMFLAKFSKSSQNRCCYVCYPPVTKHVRLENGPFNNDFPIKTSIHMGFSSQPCLIPRVKHH